VPILDEKLRARVVREGLENFLNDDRFSWALQSDGSYRRLTATGAGFSAQKELQQSLGAVAGASNGP